MLHYHEDGFELARTTFSVEDINSINARIDRYIEKSTYGIVSEEGSGLVRSLHGLHLVDEYFHRLCCHSSILNTATEIIGAPCYVHQFKVNMKQRQYGESWPWHQDFIFWNQLDGIERQEQVNVAIFLTDMHPSSGPLKIIPRSHKFGNICQRVSQKSDLSDEAQDRWLSDVSKNLTYQAADDLLHDVLLNAAPVDLLGDAGDVVYFDPMAVHSSARNRSAQDRRLLIITYNSIYNTPRNSDKGARPDFLCSPKYDALSPITDRNIFERL